MKQATKTMRDSARGLVADSVTEAAEYSHERNYWKLHVFRDGSVSWMECVNQSDDLIDDKADHFAAIPSAWLTGTGSYTCNCDYCNEVYDAADEQAAKDAGRTYDAEAKYDGPTEAIADAVANSDLSDIESTMLAAFDGIPEGYFEDEAAEAKP